MHRLFVHGTLASGRPNKHVLAHVDGTWEQATVRGDLYDRVKAPVTLSSGEFVDAWLYVDRAAAD